MNFANVAVEDRGITGQIMKIVAQKGSGLALAESFFSSIAKRLWSDFLLSAGINRNIAILKYRT